MQSINPMLLEALLEKKRRLEKGDPSHQEIKTALVVRGGAMRGVCGSAQTIALHQLGLGNVFDHVVGCSAGASALAYFLAGHEAIKKGTSIFYEELPENKFIVPWRFEQIVDLDFLISVFRKGFKELDQKTVRNHRSRFSIAVTRHRDAELELPDAKQESVDMLDLLHASMALPGLYSKPVIVSGKRYVDGGVAFSIEDAVRATGARYVLAITNHTHGEKEHSLAEKIFVRLKVEAQLRAQALGRYARESRGLRNLRKDPELVFDVLWVPASASVSMWSMDGAKLKKAAEASFHHALEFFGSPDPKASIEIAR